MAVFISIRMVRVAPEIMKKERMKERAAYYVIFMKRKF